LGDNNLATVMFHALALCYHKGGRPSEAVGFYNKQIKALKEDQLIQERSDVSLEGLSDALRLTGSLHKSESIARKALFMIREKGYRLHEGASLYRLGLVLAARGISQQSETAFTRSLRIYVRPGHNSLCGFEKGFQANT
jgi:hypothetical protein